MQERLKIWYYTELKKLYDEYLGEPNGHLAHKLLHTHYQKREKYTK